MATWIEPSVDITTEVAFDSGPWDTSPVWEDVSAYVRSVDSFRGATSEAGRFSPGRLSVTFSNGDRRFDPDHAAGPYFGDILPMKRIRITATRSAATFTLFLGWVTGWQQDWHVGDGVAYAECVDGGYFLESESLASSAYAAAVLADSPIHYWAASGDLSVLRDQVGSIDLGTSIGSTFTDSTAGAVSLNATTTDRTYPLGESDAVWTDSSSPTATSALPRTVEAWVYVPTTITNPFIQGAIDPVSLNLAQFGIYPTGSLGSGQLEVTFEDPTNNDRFSLATNTGIRLSPGMHHVAAVASSTTMTIYVDGQQAYSGALAAGTTAYGGDTTRVIIRSGTNGTTADLPMVNHVAFYSTELTHARIQAHYLAGLTAYGHPYNEEGGTRITRVLDEIGYPSNLRNISTGGIPQGPYLPASRRAMEYIDEVLSSEQGLLFFSVDGKLTFRDRQWQWITADADGVVFSDDGGVGSIGYDQGSPNSGTVDTVRNIVTVSYSTVGAITNRDQTSIDDYGPSQEFIDAPTLRNGTDASNLGKYVLRLKKDPKSTIPELLVKMRSSIATNFAPVLGLELGEVVTVERTPMGVGSQIVRRHQVTGVGHRITPDNWETRFYLSPAVPMADEVPYFTIAHATYGRVGTSAGNKIPG